MFELEILIEVLVMFIVMLLKVMEMCVFLNDSVCFDWMYWLCDYRVIICKSVLLDII